MHQRPRSLESRLTVLLLDDHELLRLGLRTLLDGQPAVTVVGEAATIAAAMAQVATVCPALVITGTALPDGDAAEACRRILTTAPGTRVAVLSGRPDEEAIVEAARAGASGWLSVHMRAADLCREIRAIASGESRIDLRAIQARPGGADGARHDLITLTPQERRVLALVTEGKTNKEIAGALALSEKTVKNYLSNVFEKLQVSRRSHAAVLYARGQSPFAARLAPPMAPESLRVS